MTDEEIGSIHRTLAYWQSFLEGKRDWLNGAVPRKKTVFEHLTAGSFEPELAMPQPRTQEELIASHRHMLLSLGGLLFETKKLLAENAQLRQELSIVKTGRSSVPLAQRQAVKVQVVDDSGA